MDAEYRSPLPHPPRRGRGAAENIPNRFAQLHVTVDLDAQEAAHMAAADRPLQTTYLRDDSQSLLTRNASPDIRFNLSLNPYRGCEHGCAYCYARPYHEYLGFSAGLDFESKIVVKEKAPELLRAALEHPKFHPEPIAMSGVTDAFQPVEKKLRISRGCLTVMRDFRQPVGIVTKNHLVTRDTDLLAELAHYKAAAVYLSVTTLDAKLARALEPRTSSPEGRLRSIQTLATAGIPVGVSIAPIIPGLNDHEIPSILTAAKEAGASFATYTVVRLPYAVKDLFSDWLTRHLPDSREKVLDRIRDLRGGKHLNDAAFGRRFRGQGIYAQTIATLFATAARKLDLPDQRISLSTEHFRRPPTGQMELF